jgi:hypothetical protein
MTAPNVVEVQLLDQLTARRLVSEARNALAVADDLLARLYAGRAWEALGHADWSALCAAELPELRHLKMRAEARIARVQALDSLGASTREIAAATGSSVGQAHKDRLKLRTAEPAPADTRPRHVQIAALVAARGTKGLTIEEAQRRTGWTYGATSGALSRAERVGLVTRPADLPPPRQLPALRGRT